MIMVVKNMKPGEISEPQVYLDERGRKTVRLIYFKEISAPHKENLKEDYNKVSFRALEEKKSKALETWFKEHINNYFIYLDPEYSACKELTDWNKVANNITKVN
jgi:peptidyl-prolyl cis-trans isomerase SurA